MKKVQYKNTDLVCLECGYVATIPRKISKQKRIGHIKDMFCPFCNKEVKFFEVKDISIFKEICRYEEDLTKEELFVMNLLKEREERNERTKLGIPKKILTKK